MTTPELLKKATKRKLVKAAINMDWGQVVSNGGPPCFHLEHGHFCGRSLWWDGHRLGTDHKFVSFGDLIKAVALAEDQ